jgi:threonine synthase
MKYISTRGQAEPLSFEDVVLTGLATDGGLYVPETIPTFSIEKIDSFAKLSYEELAFEVMSPFVGGEIPDDDFKGLISKAYSSFRHDAIAPLVQTAHQEWILELFQGPTLAFKDFALQLLGLILDYFLKKRGQQVVVLGATSGDTGSAAIEGCRNCENIDIFILHPNNRVSDVQRKQMTTVLSDNVFNIALEGNFDDCQTAVKASFRDQSFLPEGRQLVAVNSINWARIMAQIVYYFYAGVALGAPHRKVSFSVPTGNFGDIYAGYLAQSMGLPVEQLVVATNQNDILHRCIQSNDHSKKSLEKTLSPSMDIMVSSNFERMLFDAYGRDGDAIRKLMDDFSGGEMTISAKPFGVIKSLFSSYRLDDQGTADVIKSVYSTSQYLLDPHTAIGLEAGRKTRKKNDVAMICLATAHPAKFPEAIEKTGLDVDVELPLHLADLFDREERFDVLENDLSVLHQYVAERA